ncbi:glycosyltransferase family 2 protein [Nocardia carnea]|uniref:glycosyltransferase family 2 protein n=1 Tax=Nocardia carnea TaxID=37328 RepID=UPI002453E664|nr:glycosyltransferase family A protein [Nocardia carnea]
MATTTTAGLSILIPCHNSGGLVAEAVDSVLQQAFSIPFEVIVVDDGSDDPDTRSAISFAAANPHVHALRLSENQGAQTARNAGLEAARFDFVLPLDCDDRLATDSDLLRGGPYPEQAIRLLQSNPEVAFAHTFSRMFGAFDGLTISAYPVSEPLLVRKHHAPMSIVYRRTDALAAGGYDRRIRKWQDWTFAIDLLAARHRRGTVNDIACVSGPFHEYRMHRDFPRLSSTNVSEPAMTHLVVEKNLDYFRSHLGPGSSTELTSLVCASKPDRLTDLLHMAADNLGRAVTLARQRGGTWSCRWDALDVP